MSNNSRQKLVDIGVENEEFPVKDLELFEKMRLHYVSLAEQAFFENLKHREECCFSPAYDILLAPRRQSRKAFYQSARLHRL